MKKRIFFVVMATITALMLAMSVHATDIIGSGQCGDNLNWVLDSEGTLTISGSGDMWDYAPPLEPTYANIEIPNKYYDGWNYPVGSNFIKTVKFLGDVTSIGERAFSSFYELENVYTVDTITSIRNHAFDSCKINYISLPSALSSIGERAFNECEELELLSLPKSLEELGEGAFCGCSNLADIAFYGPGTHKLKTISSNAFAYCSKLKISFTVPDSVTTIGGGAFGCVPLIAVYIHKDVTSIGYSAFGGSGTIEVASDNPVYCSQDGILYSKDMKRLICYPAGSIHTELIIPNGVEIIEVGAFSDCSNIRFVEIPESVKAINTPALSILEGPLDFFNLETLYILSKDINLGSNHILFCEEMANTVNVYGFAGSTVEEYFTANPWNGNFIAINSGTPINNFTDITTTDTYYDAVKYAVENGLFNGTSETTFSPDATMTRAMFVTVLGRYAYVDTANYVTPTFTDSIAGQWYTSYVEWAAAKNVVSGYGNGIFGINDSITVEQACVILARFADKFLRDPSSSQAESKADKYDLSSVSDWASDSVKWAINNGIYADAFFQITPQAPAPRSLVAEMMLALTLAYAV